jgi:hypothetical protein
MIVGIAARLKPAVQGLIGFFPDWDMVTAVR